MSFFKRRQRKEVLQEQEARFQEFKEQLKEEPLEKGDYFAMVAGAFMALWPALLAVIALIIGVSLFFLR